MALGAICCPKSVKACAIRLTRLQANGLPYPPTELYRTVQGSGFMELTLNPDYESEGEVVIRNPGGNIAVIHQDFDVLKGMEVTLRICALGGLLAPLGVVALAETTDDPGVTNVPGYALTDDIGDPCADPWMVEVWSKNVADTAGSLDDCARWIHWVLPWTHNWTLASNLTFGSGAVEVELQGYARSNGWWYPAFPGPTFASYLGDYPAGPAPAVLPPGVTADEWTTDDLDTIREAGPLAWKCVSALPSPLDDCTLIPNDCGDQESFADGPFTAGGDGLLVTPPYLASELFPWL